MREILARASGIDIDSLREPKLLQRSQGLADVYTSLLDLADQTGTAPFKGMKIDPEVVSNNANFGKLLETFDQTRALLAMNLEIQRHASVSKQSPLEVWKRIQNDIGWEPGTLTAQNLAQIHSRSRKILEGYLSEYLKESMEGVDFSKLKDLEKTWGDLLPVYTLIGRFSTNDAWKKELPELGKIFRASIDGTFADFKFRGLGDSPDAAKAELASLKTPQQQSEWERDRGRVTLWNPTTNGKKDSREILIKSLRETVDSNLRVHLGDIPPARDEQATAQLEGLLAQAKESPKEALSKARSFFPGDSRAEADKKIVASALHILAQTNEPATAAKVARRLKQLIRGTEGEFNFSVSEDVVRDLDQISDAMKASLTPSSEDHLIVTQTSSDPKLLLTVGALTSESSCQDYRGGGIIGTLLGYVKGANVKLMYGTVLKVGDFARKEDFLSVRNAIQDGSTLSTSIMPADKSIVFQWADSSGTSHSVRSAGQKIGFMRNILKLGATDKEEPGLFLERGYKSSTAAQPILEQQALQVMDDVAKAINGQVGVTINIPPSRNPGGVYSDAVRRSVTDAYSIPGNPAQRLDPQTGP